MSRSRQKILDALEAAAAPPEADDGGSRRELRKAAALTLPGDRAGLTERFTHEVLRVDGEVHTAATLHTAADIILGILKEEKSGCLAVSAEEIVRQAASITAGSPGGPELLDVRDLAAPERKTRTALCRTALAGASCGIADTGSIAFFYDESRTSYPHFLAETVLVLIKPDQILPDLFSLTETAEPAKLRNMVLVTGPSRTADIEKILILGAHGPRRLVVIVYTGPDPDPHSGEKKL